MAEAPGAGGWHRPQPLEVASGLALGADPDATPLGTAGCGRPRAVIEASVGRALSRPPCLVSFSGGRDSSAVLGTAAAVARREGLPLPVAVTYRFAGAPGTHEDRWQEQVIRHLHLPDWERVPITDDLDAIGPVARTVLARQGLLWPFNAHFPVPLLQRAAGGALLTGIGGDELLGRQLWATARAVLSGRRQPRPRRLLSLGVALSPTPVREALLARRHEIRWPWLRPEVDHAVNRQRASWQARTPLSWAGAVGWWWGSRSRTVLSATMELLAADAGTQVVHPFMEPSVVGAVAASFGRWGPANRSAAMRALFGDVLPEPVLTRRSKASFDEAFFSHHSRAFAQEWTGDGVDTSLVEPDRLAQVWATDHPDPRSFLLLQAAWLAGTASRVPANDGRQDGETGPTRA